MKNKRKNLIVVVVVLCIVAIIIAFAVMAKAHNYPNEGYEDFSEMAIHNRKFTVYIGKQKGTTIKSLLNKVISNNATSENQVEVVAAVIGITEKEPADIAKEIPSSLDYNVDIEYSEDGFVNKIIITDTDTNHESPTFIKTYNILNMIDSNDENYIYLTIRQFQEEEIKTVKVEKI